MANWTYTTKQGDTWDAIARDIYGTEMLSGFLQQANSGYLNLVHFPSGIVLVIPAPPEKATAGQVAPWKRSTATAQANNPVGKVILDYSRFSPVAAGGDHDKLNKREASGQHPTSAIVHGISKRPLDELLDSIISALASGGTLFKLDPESGSIVVRDEPLEI